MLWGFRPPRSTQYARRSRIPIPGEAPHAARLPRSPPGRGHSGTSVDVRRKPDEIAPRLLVTLEAEASAALGLFEHSVERSEPVIGLVESRLAALQRLLDHRTPHLLLITALGDQGLDGSDDQVE